jgi:hypothetical protein
MQSEVLRSILKVWPYSRHSDSFIPLFFDLHLYLCDLEKKQNGYRTDNRFHPFFSQSFMLRPLAWRRHLYCDSVFTQGTGAGKVTKHYFEEFPIYIFFFELAADPPTQFRVFLGFLDFF